METLRRKLETFALTDFEVEVLLAVSSIKKGEVKSYKQIAQEIKRPNAYRAVGNALAKNPMPIKIPCHRVIMSNGSLGKYSYGGVKKKMKLLISESYAHRERE
ncbi:MAG: methylated-DNA--[protein]-cysteine S-methyltransferase [Candidatus Micrarchaeia archaeon]